jgi:hypothetical protein
MDAIVTRQLFYGFARRAAVAGCASRRSASRLGQLSSGDFEHLSSAYCCLKCFSRSHDRHALHLNAPVGSYSWFNPALSVLYPVCADVLCHSHRSQQIIADCNYLEATPLLIKSENSRLNQHPNRNYFLRSRRSWTIVLARLFIAGFAKCCKDWVIENHLQQSKPMLL